MSTVAIENPDHVMEAARANTLISEPPKPRPIRPRSASLWS